MSTFKDWLARDVLIVGKLEAADEIYVPGCGYYTPEPGAHIVICENAEPLHEVQGEEATAPVPFEDVPEFERMSYEELEAWAMHAWYDEAYTRDENRRLRELLKDTWHFIFGSTNGGPISASEWHEKALSIHDRMRVLGIEVD